MKILICPECKKKLYYFKEEPYYGILVCAEILKPYSEEIEQPINGKKALCSYCKAELKFKPAYVINE